MQYLTTEPTLCMAAIYVTCLYPATSFHKAFRNTVSLQNLLLWPVGSEVTKKQWMCKHHLFMNRGTYQRQTHSGPVVNTLSRIQV